MAIQPFTQVNHVNPYERLSPAKLAAEYASKHVLVTGGGYGIGASIARAFAEAQVSSLIIAGRTESKLKATADELGAAFPKTDVQYRTVDIASAESVKAMYDSISTPLDVLVNNAGYLSQPTNFVQADLKEWWASFEVNVLGTAVLTQAFLRARAKQNATEEAAVLTINSVVAYNLMFPNLSAYAASKAASWRAMEMVAADVAVDPSLVPGGVRVVSIHPGMVLTAMAAKSGLGDFEPTDARLTGEFVAWTASKEASFLANRFAWVGWDVDELVARKEEILEKDLLRTSISM